MVFLVFEASSPSGAVYRFGLAASWPPLAAIVAVLARMI